MEHSESFINVSSFELYLDIMKSFNEPPSHKSVNINKYLSVFITSWNFSIFSWFNFFNNSASIK